MEASLKENASAVGVADAAPDGSAVATSTPPRLAPPAARASAPPSPPVREPARPAARTPSELVETAPDAPVNKMRRRVVWASISGFLLTWFIAFFRFFLPRSILEPSSIFKIGFASDYALGVDTKYQQQYRIWVDKTADRIFVIYARCTHLGCTPDWKASENKFKCPCHGSGYDSEGINFEGPAPRPMDRAHLQLDAEGQMVVDTNRLFKWPKGERNEFNDPGAFLQL